MSRGHALNPRRVIASGSKGESSLHHAVSRDISISRVANLRNNYQPNYFGCEERSVCPHIEWVPMQIAVGMSLLDVVEFSLAGKERCKNIKRLYGCSLSARVPGEALQLWSPMRMILSCSKDQSRRGCVIDGTRELSILNPSRFDFESQEAQSPW